MKFNSSYFLIFFLFSVFTYSCSTPEFTQRKYFDGRNNDNVLFSQKPDKKTVLNQGPLEIKKITETKEVEFIKEKDIELTSAVISNPVNEPIKGTFNQFPVDFIEKDRSERILTKFSEKTFFVLENFSEDDKDFSLMNVLELTSFLFVIISVVLLLLSNILWIAFAGAAIVLFILVQIIWR
ncbi:MAG: hypothetical protein M3Q58_00760 [Bacteroidota bacterium]|nr:hypothetical protein [Bacteroidota bacterium]